MSNGRFHTRGFISLLTGFSALFMSLTGIILYIEPAGRVAYWMDWRLLFLTKEQWDDLHILTSLLFVAGAIYHLYLNWPVFVRYIIKKAEHALALKRELAVASLLTLIFILSSVYKVPPLSYLLTLSEQIKDLWLSDKELLPPFSHAELMTLRNFAKKTGLDPESAINELKDRGLNVSSGDETLKDIAKKNNTSPLEIYKIIRPLEQKALPNKKIALTPQMVEERFAGSGIGKKTLSDICKENNIDISLAKARLSKNGIKVKEDDKMRDIAERHKIEPIEVLKFILIEDYPNLKKSS